MNFRVHNPPEDIQEMIYNKQIELSKKKPTKVNLMTAVFALLRELLMHRKQKT